MNVQQSQILTHKNIVEKYRLTQSLHTVILYSLCWIFYESNRWILRGQPTRSQSHIQLCFKNILMKRAVLAMIAMMVITISMIFGSLEKNILQSMI